MNDNEIFQINIREILKTKAPKLYKKIPKFLVNCLAKIICQDKLNDILRRNANVTGVDFMENAVKDFKLTLQLEGTENLPDFDKKCIFVANHPLGGLDGICLSAVLGKQYDKKIKYLVNDVLYFLKPLQNIFVPINKYGRQTKDAASMINEAFSSDNQIITFPAGLCSRKIKGEIIDLEWKKMFIAKAIEYQRDVIPVYFGAQNSKLFYNIANIREKLGIKFNIELVLLPSEMFKAENAVFKIYFGNSISWQTFDSSKTHQQWADEIKKHVYDIK
jgi:hypothetical protein